MLEGFGRAGQGTLRNVEQHAPGFAAGDRRKGSQDFQTLLILDAVQRCAVGQQADQFGTFLSVDLINALGQFARVRAVASQQAHGAEDAHLGLALVKVAAGLLAQGLQAVQVNVDGQGGDHFVCDHQREHDAGHQHPLAVNLIEIRFDDTGLAGRTRAHRPGVGRLAAGADAGIGHVTFRQGHGGQLARGRLRPVQGKAAFFVAAQLLLVDEQFVFVVQRIGLEYQRQAKQIRVGLQGCTYLASQVLTQIESIEKALLRLFAQE
ncbi:hypothetical protein D3C79_669280 [compost metagenome]